jgi:hypothetical protein
MLHGCVTVTENVALSMYSVGVTDYGNGVTSADDKE